MIAENLAQIRASIPQGVELVAVSKFHPVERLLEAYNAGQRIFAESRPQELAAKVPQLPPDIQWHFIGHLQTNKLKLVLPYVSLVQSVDSRHLLEAINTWGAAHDRVIDVLLELHLGAEDTKQGFTEEELLSLFQETGAASSAFASRPLPQTSSAGPSLLHGRGWPWADEAAPASWSNVRIRGLMGMATNTDDMTVVERDFTRMEKLFRTLREEHPELSELSIGMSADWPIAVRHGATMVRIGTDIFGPREY